MERDDTSERVISATEVFFQPGLSPIFELLVEAFDEPDWGSSRHKDMKAIWSFLHCCNTILTV